MFASNKKVYVCLFLMVMIPYNQNCYAQLNSSTYVSNKKAQFKLQTSYKPTPNPVTEDLQDELVAIIFEAIALSIWVTFVGNVSSESHLHKPLTKYPYKNALAGNYTKTDPENSPKNIRFDIEDNFLYSDNNVYGNHLKVKLRPFQYFYFQTELFHLSAYNTTNDAYDNRSLYNLDFCYDRIRFERFNLGWTAGANYIANDVKKGGFAFGFNTEIFIAKPISIYSSIKWSGINKQPANTFEVKVNYHYKRYFASLGYQYLKIGTPRYDFAAFGLGVYL